MWLVMIFSLAFASSSLWGKSWGLHPCGATSLHIVPPPNSSLTPLFSETRLKRMDFQEVARLAWAHAVRLQQLHPSLLTANVSNKSGNLKDKPAAECLRCCVKQGTKYTLEGARSGARQIRGAESHREGNVERRDPDGGIRASGEVTQITTGNIRRRLCPAILRFLLSR